jgi:hypothetical protein
VSRPLPSLAALLTAVTLALGVVGVVGVEATGAPAAPRDPGRAHAPVLDHRSGVGPATVARAQGPDGRLVSGRGAAYLPAPMSVEGRDGYLFYGEDFDSACLDGEQFDLGLRRMRAFARMLRAAGKRVLFSVAPNKSGVLPGELAGLPHGSCDRSGLRHQAAALDAFRDADFIAMRARLARMAARGVQLYWHMDTHWTTVASTRYAFQVARRLDLRLAKRQRYAPARRTILPDLMQLQGIYDVRETAPARRTTTRVRVAEGPSGAEDPAAPGWADQSWESRPAARTWRGRSLLVGDSFTFTALESLRPLFRHGRFLWIGLASLDEIAAAMAEADTVVLEVVQRYVGRSVLLQPSFRKTLQQALAERS